RPAPASPVTPWSTTCRCGTGSGAPPSGTRARTSRRRRRSAPSSSPPTSSATRRTRAPSTWRSPAGWTGRSCRPPGPATSSSGRPSSCRTSPGSPRCDRATSSPPARRAASGPAGIPRSSSPPARCSRPPSRRSAPARTSWWRTGRDGRRGQGGERPARPGAPRRSGVVRPRAVAGGARRRVVGGPGAGPPGRVPPLLRRGAGPLAGGPGGRRRAHARTPRPAGRRRVAGGGARRADRRDGRGQRRTGRRPRGVGRRRHRGQDRERQVRSRAAVGLPRPLRPRPQGRPPGAVAGPAVMPAGCTPFPAEFAERYRGEGYWRGERLGHPLRRWTAAGGDRVAVTGGGRSMTYAELDAAADRVAAGLRRLGLARHDRVVVQLANVVEFPAIVFGLLRLGALPVFALPPHREHEIGYLAEHAEAVAYLACARVGGFAYGDLGATARKASPALRHVLLLDGPDDERNGVVDLRRLLDAPLDPAEAAAAADADPPDPADAAFFLLSGGTTGLPKLIPRTHDDYAYNVAASAEVTGLDASTVYLVALPAAHNFPLGCPGLMGTLAAGGRVVMAPSPKPE